MVSMNIFSQIAGAHLVADTVRPSSDGSRRGWPSYDPAGSVRLPRTVHPNSHRLFPAAQPASALAGRREDIDSRPDFGRRSSSEMLMGSEVMVQVVGSWLQVAGCGLSEGQDGEKSRLHGAGRVAASQGPGLGRLHVVEGLSAGGNLGPRGSHPLGGGVDSGQYRRGTSAAASQGVHPAPVDCEGQLGRAAHPAHDRAATRVFQWRQAAGDRGGVADCRPPAGGADQSSSARLTVSNQQPTTSNGANKLLTDPARLGRRMGISLSCNPAP